MGQIVLRDRYTLRETLLRRNALCSSPDVTGTIEVLDCVSNPAWGWTTLPAFWIVW